MLPVTKIQRFSTHDGPGIRTAVFLKGCPLSCVWCHNPETHNDAPGFYYDEQCCMNCRVCMTGGCPAGARQPSFTMMNIDSIVNEVLKDETFYGNDGGLTISGGEPMQHNETIKLIRRAKNSGLHTVVETCGFFDSRYLQALTEVDLVLWDIKNTDDIRHQKYTGVSNRGIIDNLINFDKFGGKTVLRCIMIHGVNFNEAHLAAIKNLQNQLNHCHGVELLPFHPYGESKYRKLGMEWNGSAFKAPSPEEMAWARKVMSRLF
jgi:pyruvate formate lyase activating enzyme